MGWLQQSYKKSSFRLPADSRSFDTRISRIRRQCHAGLVALAAAGLSAPTYVFALDMAHSANSAARPKMVNLSRMSDNDLRDISAQGYNDPLMSSERFFEGVSKYMAQGNTVSVLGDLGSFLNPPLSMIELLNAQDSFKNIFFNPNNLSTIVGNDGSVYFLRPSTLEQLRYKSVSSSIGTVEVRDVEMRGSRLISKKH